MIFFIFTQILIEYSVWRLGLRCLSISYKKDVRLKWVNVNSTPLRVYVTDALEFILIQIFDLHSS